MSSFSSRPSVLTMSIPSQQIGLAILTKRGAWGLVPAGVDLPGPGELLIRVEATALNPIDWKVQATEYAEYLQEYPAILGSDGAGVVVAVGEGVANFAIGDRTYVSERSYISEKIGDSDAVGCTKATSRTAWRPSSNIPSFLQISPPK